MKKYFLFAAAALVAMTMGLSSCNNKSADNDPAIPTDSSQPSEDAPLTPEETKKKLMSIAKDLSGKFNPEDQREIGQFAADLYEKYETYGWDNVEKFYAHRYDEMFDLSVELAEWVTGNSATPVYRNLNLGFVTESVIFEADEFTKTWRNQGKAEDNSIIFRFKDKNGVQCEAKAWGEGDIHEIDYRWEEYHWDAPRIYAQAYMEYTYHWGQGLYRGEPRYFYMDEDKRWYYYEEDYNERHYVEESAINYIYATGIDGATYYYDKVTHMYYTKDWENKYKVLDTVHTVRCAIPEKFFLTLKQGEKEFISAELDQEMVKNDHATFAVTAKGAEFECTADVNIHSEHASMACAVSYKNDKLISTAINLPKYKLIEKADSVLFEDWIREYSDRYEELIRKVGDADAIVDVMGQVQVRAITDNLSYLIRDFTRRSYSTEGSKEEVEKLCDMFNYNQRNGLYFNSNVKQATVLAQPMVEVSESGYENWFMETVIFFPGDSTSYSIDSYFTRKPFTDVEWMIEDLANDYIDLYEELFGEEIGEFHFNF